MAKSVSQPRSSVILTYHSIDNSGSVLSTSPRVFAAQMRVLAELGTDVVSVEEIARPKITSNGASPMVAITFDDGFSNIYEHAFPVLRQYGFSSTVFLVTDYCGGMNSWPSQPPSILRQPLLSWDQIREMSRSGVRFGSHTRTHPDLTKLSPRDAGQELLGSKKMIEDAVGLPVDTFAYPYGAFNEMVKKLTETYFGLACSTALGFVRPGSDCFALERLDMYYLRHTSLFHRLFSWKIGTYIRFRRIARDTRKRIPLWINSLTHSD